MITRKLITGSTPSAPTDPYPGLANWRTARSGRASARADIVVMGDSQAEGQGASLSNRRYIERLQYNLRRRFPTTGVEKGGEGFVNGYYLQSSFYSGWSYGDNVTGDGSFGLGHRSLVLQPPSAYGVRTVYGTSIKLRWVGSNSTGAFAVKLDGSSTPAATIHTNTGDGTAHMSSQTVSLGSRDTHSVRLEWLNDGPVGSCYVNGFHVYDQDEAKGIHVTDCAQYGSTANNWSTTGLGTMYNTWEAIAEINPALLIVELGGNDRQGNRTPAQFKTDIQNIVSNANAAIGPDPTILFVGLDSWGNGVNPTSAYTAAMQEVADSNPTNIMCVDFSGVLPDGGDLVWGMYAPDNVHFSDIGHQFVADQLTTLLSA